jgi:hypothetical protein
MLFSVFPAGGGVAILQIFLPTKPSFKITFLLLHLFANGRELGLLLLPRGEPVKFRQATIRLAIGRLHLFADVTGLFSLFSGFPRTILLVWETLMNGNDLNLRRSHSPAQ